MKIEKDIKILIAGDHGMLGSAISRRFKESTYSNFILQTPLELDLRKQAAVQAFFEKEKPDYVFLAASRDGGISANKTYPSGFMYDNIMMEANVIHECYRTGVKRLFLFASSFVYPHGVSQPIKEESLLERKLEPSYEFYAISKIAGIKMCQAYNQQHDCRFVSIIHNDLYGENDQYGSLDAHVVPALIQRIYEAKIYNKGAVEVWGTGTAKREFLHVDDLADACFFLMDREDCPEIINVGTEEYVTIREVADFIRLHIGYSGHLYFNPAKPDVTEPRTLDTSTMNQLGWYPKIKLLPGLKKVFQAYERDHHGLSEDSLVF